MTDNTVSDWLVYPVVYVIHTYCHPCESDGELLAVRRLMNKWASLVLGRHIGQQCKMALFKTVCGFPDYENEVRNRLARNGAILTGDVTIFDGDDAILFSLEVSVNG